MAARAQIPRFGDWDKHDIPYSVYFDNARKERSGVRINPNDPVENSDTFYQKEAIKECSNFEGNSEEDSIQICLPRKQRNGTGVFTNALRSHSDRPRIEIYPEGAPSDNQDDEAFYRMGSIKSFDRLSLSERKYPGFSNRWTETWQHQWQSSVPKFGTWTNNDVQYTAYFENARKDKAGFGMNPNDPEENQDAFWFKTGSRENDDDFSSESAPRLSPGSSRQLSLSVNCHNSQLNAGYHRECHTRRRAPERSTTLEEGTSGTNSRHNGQQITATGNRNGALRSSSTGTSSARGNVESFRWSNTIQPYHSPYQRSPSAPEFARGDETDPNSEEGYSDTFSTVKEEKEIKPSESCPPPALPVPTNNPNDQNHQKKQGGLFSRLKASCCLYVDRKE